MKIFKITKTYMVVATNRIAADAIIRSRDVADLFEVGEAVEELPELLETNEPRMKPWFDELKRQLS
jgi:hypothetical protein